MQWRDPQFLWLLLVVAVLAVALVAFLRRRAQQLNLFAAEPLVARLAPDLDTRRRTWRIGLRLLALVILVLTLAGPKWGFEWREVKREGIDLIVALDTSRSMLAGDVKPNRLERAKLAIQDMVQLLDGDRIALVAFAGTAFLQCPLTVDYAAFEASLRATNVGIIPRGGTALERAIDTSLAAFEAGEGKHQAVILITDGEDHEGDPEKAADRAAERGVKVFTVGIGTTEGELVPASEGASGFLKDRKGQVVKTRLNEDGLEKIAIKSDGAYVHGGGPSLGLDELFRDHIAKMEKREVASSLERLYEERFQIPLVLVLVLLFAESWIGDRKPAADRRRWLRLPWPFRKPVGTSAPARGSAELGTIVLLLAFTPSLLGWLDPRGDRAAEGNRLYEQGKYEEAASKYGDGLVDAPGSPLLQFNLGTALYKQGKYEEAVGPLSKVAASNDPNWTARASYNLGNALYRLAAGAEESDPQGAIGRYEEALAAYKRAMGAAPQDADPKYNHELVSRKLEELKKRLEEEKKKQEEEQKEKEEQQQDEAQQDQQDQQDQEQQRQDQEQQQDQQQQDQQPQDQAQQNQEQQEQQQQAQDQPQGDEQKPEEQQQDQQGEQQQQAGEPPEQPEQDQAQQQAGAGEQQPPSDEQQGEQAQAGGGQPMGEPSEEQNPDQQAAQAVLDMAGQEELRPEDMHRQMGVAGVGEPLQDW